MDKLRKTQLSLLVHLANVDDDFAFEERQAIFSIGRQYGVDDDQIHHIIESPDAIDKITELGYDSKFDSLYDCVQLMLVDGIIDQNEIFFCQMAALKLGFKVAVIQFLTDERHSPKEYLRRLILERGYF